MKILYLGIFLLICVIAWVFFVILRIHALKFLNFSSNLKKVIDFVFVLLVICTIGGIIAILFLPTEISNIGPKTPYYGETTSKNDNYY